MKNSDVKPEGELAFLTGGGVMGDLIARFDWTQTSVGPIDRWSPELKSTISLMLRSPVPMVLLWGPQGKMIYNDGYAIFAGPRHPKLLGSKVLEGWPEVADFNAHILKVVLGGGTLSFREQALVLDRGHGPKTAWFDLDYSPILDGSGRPAGVIAIVIETTSKVVAERWRTSERERQSQMFEQAPGFMAMLAGPTHIFELANAGYRQLVGHRELIGHTVKETFPDIADQGFLELLDQVYRSGEAFVGNGLRAELQRTPDGAREERFIDLIYQPIRNPDSEVIGILVQGVDVTERVAAERALRESERRLTLSQKAAGIGSLEIDIASETVFGTPQLWEIWGMPQRESVPIKLLEDLVVPHDIALRSNAENRARGTTPPHAEYRIRRANDGQVRWVSRSVDFVHDDHGKPVKMFGVMQDITERKEAEARQKTLAHELEHRIKNILATVGAIVSQTLRNTDIDTARTALRARLEALASAHDILNQTRWANASMQQVIEAATVPFDKERITISGPSLSLTPKMAIAMGLAVNELGTNAVKYGALSVPAGHVDIRWNLKLEKASPGKSLVWTWREHDGPPVTTPTRQGFGSILIESVVSADFSGHIALDYRKDGLICTLTAPWTQD